MDKVEVVTELRIRREVKRKIRVEFVRDVQEHCRPRTELNEISLFGWERRKHCPDRVHAAALRAHLDVSSIAELGLGYTEDADLHWTFATKDERRLEVERRLLLRKGVEMGIAPLLPVGPLTALAQRLGGRPRIGPGDVAIAQQVATKLATKYLAAPSAETARAAVAHAYTLIDRLRHADSLTNSTVRAQLMAVASDAAALAGFTYAEGERNAEARSWYQEALGLAREAGDRRLEALSYAGIALAAWPACTRLPRGGRPAGSLEASQAAAALDRHLPPAGRAYVHGVLSGELALAGEDAASGRALGRMLAAAARVGQDDAGWGYWSQHGHLSGWADTPRATVYRGLRPYFLGRHRDAVPLFEEALEGTALPGRRAITHLDLAVAWTDLDDPDRASAAGIAVLDEVGGLDFGAIKEVLRRVRDGWPSEWDDLESVRELDERLTTA